MCCNLMQTPLARLSFKNAVRSTCKIVIRKCCSCNDEGRFKDRICLHKCMSPKHQKPEILETTESLGPKNSHIECLKCHMYSKKKFTEQVTVPQQCLTGVRPRIFDVGN